MKDDTGGRDPIRVETHRDLRRHIRVICRRFNSQPELARLLMVNPVFALEDAGVELTPELKEHIVSRLRFPPKLVERIAQLELELRAQFIALGIDADLPLSAEARRHVLVDVLGVPPEEPDVLARRRRVRSKAFREQYPLAATLAEYERARQGALIFQPRHVYEAHKSGQRRHRWLRSISFRV